MNADKNKESLEALFAEFVYGQRFFRVDLAEEFLDVFGQNVALQVGAVSEQVTVQAGAELIETRTAAAGQLVDEKRIIELPLNGRRPERLVYLAAGTIDLGRDSCQICGQGGVYPGEETAGVNGAGIYQVNFQLDGTRSTVLL